MARESHRQFKYNDIEYKKISRNVRFLFIEEYFGGFEMSPIHWLRPQLNKYILICAIRYSCGIWRKTTNLGDERYIREKNMHEGDNGRLGITRCCYQKMKDEEVEMKSQQPAVTAVSAVFPGLMIRRIE